MQELFKRLLKKPGIYHPLQSFYRNLLFARAQKNLRNEYAKYAGAGFTCNVCGRQYKMFAPLLPSKQNSKAIFENNVIAGYGKNILCPNCMSGARDRLVIAMLADHFHWDNKKVLMVSPEKPVFDFIRSKGCDILSADLYPGYYKAIDKDIRKEDITALSFEENSFDIVIANHVLEHVQDDRKAMAEIYRVLKFGGCAILQVPFSETIVTTIESGEKLDDKGRSALFGQKDHVRIYALHDYLKRLRSAGFIVDIRLYQSLQPYYRFAIQKGEHFLINVKAVIS